MNTLIEKICARQILDSRGIPTLEVDIHLQDGTTGSASVPSGLSRGRNEAFELRDGIRDFYGGKSVWQAVNHVNRVLSDTLRSMDVRNQQQIDETMLELDGTQDKHRLGANAILGVSLACARAAANALRIPLFQYLGGLFAFSIPIPMVNVLNGGVHADNPLEIQEFMLVPQNFRSFSDSIRAVCECFYELKSILMSENLSTNVGDEGGFAPNISSHEKAFEFLVSAIRKAGYVPGEQMKIAIDAAASCFFRDGKYYFQEKTYSSKEMVLLYESWCRNFPICSIEDGLAQDDWDGWFFMTELLGENIQIVGDDLFCTNRSLLRKGIQKHSANAILIKPNQTGTLSETFETIRMAKKNGFRTIVSHRSGETTDPFISDLAVAVQADFIKSGSVVRTERTSKYNQLLRIEQSLAQSTFTPSEEILLESI
ncbi:MAG: phosphopyruvate hydratase [Planctomycetaceae bacterium]|nr:phosphopyruvate hydratase [Planctomycetaceae bacterium]MBQ2822507.1 phosphopyruvate hydratase [Thermoguttaceae bacterium]MDO4424916.1 phosphopyruvate hydratase [Planctomycetia bacterium]